MTLASTVFKKSPKTKVSVFLFVALSCRDMQQNWIDNMARPMNGTVFGVYALINKKS